MEELQMVGEWKAWLNSTLVSDPRMTSPRHHVIVFRQGPGGESERLYEETSSGRPRSTPRNDGLMVIRSNQLGFYFPGERQPMTPRLPALKNAPKGWEIYSHYLEKLFVFDEVLFYQRMPYNGGISFGFIEPGSARARFPRMCAGGSLWTPL